MTMHIALICPGGPGHLNPMATLGGELARRGHRISVLARPLAKQKADICGFELLPVGERELDELKAGYHKLARMKGLGALMLTGRLLRDGAATTLREGLERLQAAGVEAVVVDRSRWPVWRWPKPSGFPS
jgi:zeaxanthin glucosyltransferase